MKTFKRVCLQDYVVTAKNGDQAEVKRAHEYITSDERNGEVTVFGRFWAPFPLSIFAGARVFTL